MDFPNWGTVAGVAAKMIDKFTDPRRRKEALLNEKEAIFRKPFTPRNSQRLARIDAELLRLEREIERRAD